MKKYVVTGYSRYSVKPKIKEVEVERETDKTVWINGRRNAKISEWHNYFDTRGEAKGHLIKLQTTICRNLKDRLKSAKEVLLEVVKL